MFGQEIGIHPSEADLIPLGELLLVLFYVDEGQRVEGGIPAGETLSTLPRKW